MRKLRLTLLALLALNAQPARTTTTHPESAATVARFRIDAARSDFMVRAFAGGALWFKGHDHFVRPREFSGEVTLTPTAVTPATLTMSVAAASLAETREVFTEPQKQIINKELREIVIEPDKYPEITFRSTTVRVDIPTRSEFDVTIEGDLTLHGVTRRVRILAWVTITGGDLRARGEFLISRKDFGVKATSAFHGTVRVRDKLKVSFNIVARQV
jgi:polyisoprenoid-binding protein YceI